MSSNTSRPRPGQTFRCPECNRDSIVKVRKVMDGWRCVGEALVCAFCGASLGAPEDPGAADSRGAAEARGRLAALLDTEPPRRPEFKDRDKGRFCKDCRHFFKHPFYSKCLLHEKTVEPMEDCADFTERPQPPEGGPSTSEGAAPGAG